MITACATSTIILDSLMSLRDGKSVIEERQNCQKHLEWLKILSPLIFNGILGLLKILTQIKTGVKCENSEFICDSLYLDESSVPLLMIFIPYYMSYHPTFLSMWMYKGIKDLIYSPLTSMENLPLPSMDFGSGLKWAQISLSASWGLLFLWQVCLFTWLAVV